jgi:hypothetical protein
MVGDVVSVVCGESGMVGVGVGVNVSGDVWLELVIESE